MEYIVGEGLKILMKSSSDFIFYCFIKKQTLVSVYRFPCHDNVGKLIYIYSTRQTGGDGRGLHQNKMRQLLIANIAKATSDTKA